LTRSTGKFTRPDIPVEVAMAEELNAVELATELTIAWLGNPNTRATAEEVPAFLEKMHKAVNGLSSTRATATEEAVTEYEPAVSVRKSLGSKDHIISLIDGKPYKTLRRHLSGHGLTPEQYRERYNLKPDYPMVAESYSETRRAMAKKIGLGRKPKAGAVGAAPATPRKRKPRAPAKA
jgi:predicted transcriptional regulator